MYVCVYLVYYYIKYSRQGEGGKKYTLACSTTTTAGRRDVLAVARSNFLTPDCLVLFGAPGSLLSFNVGPAAQFSKKKKRKKKKLSNKVE
jgi:hypothetical protein